MRANTVLVCARPPAWLRRLRGLARRWLDPLLLDVHRSQGPPSRLQNLVLIPVAASPAAHGGALTLILFGDEPDARWLDGLRRMTPGCGTPRQADACPRQGDLVLLYTGIEVAEGWLEQLRRQAHSADDVGVVGPRTVLPDGRLLQAGLYPGCATGLCHGRGYHEVDVGQYARTRRVEAVSGACMFIRDRALEAAGAPLDGPMWDVAYCSLVGRLGLRTLLAGGVTVRHLARPSGLAREVRARVPDRLGCTSELAAVLRCPAVAWRAALIDALAGAGVRLRLEPLSGGTMGGDDDLVELEARRTRVPARAPRLSVVERRGQRVSSEVAYVMPGAGRVKQKSTQVWACSRTTPGASRVIPLGVDADRFHPRIRSTPRSQFVFFSLLSSREWQWLDFLIGAYQRAFRRSEPVLYRVITDGFGAVPRYDPRGASLSVACSAVFPAYQRGCLYRSCDCLVSPPGWSTPMEAAACATPVVVPVTGPHTDFLDADTAHFFDWRPGRLERALRAAFEQREKSHRKALEASRRLLSDWTMEHTAAAFVEGLTELR